MIGLLGKKIGMTRVFDADGHAVPVTVLELGPCTILQVKTKEQDGYEALQLGFEDKPERVSIRPEIGHAKKAGVSPKRYVREVRTGNIEGLTAGQILRVNNFAVGDVVDVVGTSIGRGFQGVVKRHHFKGSLSKSHGSMMGRAPGSIGSSSFPSRVYKGMKMAGHMGNARATAQKVRVVKIDFDKNLMAVRGGVPGTDQGYVIVHEAVKKPRPRTWRKPEDGMEELKIVERKAPVKKAKAAAIKKAAPAPAKAAK
jgi:large subunit ribosomal protein L3